MVKLVVGNGGGTCRLGVPVDEDGCDLKLEGWYFPKGMDITSGGKPGERMLCGPFVMDSLMGVLVTDMAKGASGKVMGLVSRGW
jgi:hypothetical protein